MKTVPIHGILGLCIQEEISSELKQDCEALAVGCSVC